jgi:ankyrin repeat protein
MVFEDCAIDAIVHYRQELLEWLIENGLDLLNNGLHEAAGCGNLEAVLFCADQGLDLNGADRGNTTPLMRAAGAGSIDALRFFLQTAGADVNAVNRTGVLFKFTIPPFTSPSGQTCTRL